MRKFIVFLFTALVVSSSQALSETVSFDQLAVSSDLTASKYNTDLNRIYQKVNYSIDDTNIENDSLKEADFADEINPRIRFYEQGGSGSECEMVYTGLLPTTTSGTLTGSIPAGTAYVRGYRIVKTGATAKTFTASKWTFVDLDSSSNFQYSEVSIGATTPAVAANSLRLVRVSTDATEVTNVQDLRVTSCTNAKFSTTKEVTTEASLNDVLANGTPVRKTYPGGTPPQGFAQGLYVSWDAYNTFKVTAGSAYINGKYRKLGSDLTVTTGADDPSNGVSGIVSGSVGASTTYKVYAVADQDATSALSVSFGTGPTGLTNYREIGQIKTDGGTAFTSSDIYTAHGVMPNELQNIKGWITFNGGGTVSINDSFNVSGITDNGTGDYTVTWDTDFASNDYVAAGTAWTGAASPAFGWIATDGHQAAYASGSFRFVCMGAAGSAIDCDKVTVMAIGD